MRIRKITQPVTEPEEIIDLMNSRSQAMGCATFLTQEPASVESLQLRGFIRAHSRCGGPRHADLRPVALDGYRLLLTCGCGVEFKRWVLPKDADDALAPLGRAAAAL